MPGPLQWRVHPRTSLRFFIVIADSAAFTCRVVPTCSCVRGVRTGAPIGPTGPPKFRDRCCKGQAVRIPRRVKRHRYSLLPGLFACNAYLLRLGLFGMMFVSRTVDCYCSF
jgi:hypothetical protein